MQFSLEVHNAIWQYAPKCSKSKSQGSNKPTQQLSDVGAHSLPNRSSHDENCWVLFARKISSEMPLKTSSLWTHWVWAATRCWWAEQATLPDVFGSTRGLGARLHNFNTFGHRTITSSFRCFQRQCYLNWVTLLWSAVAGELSSRCQTWSTLPQVQQEDLKQIAFDVSILRDTGNQFPISKLIFSLSQYLGAAHGLTGILQMLLSVPGYFQVILAPSRSNAAKYLHLIQNIIISNDSCNQIDIQD